MDINKFKQMEPMKYLGAQPAKAKVNQFLNDPSSFAGWTASIKIDGEYGRVLFDEDKNVLIQGRGKSRKTGEYVDKTAHLPHIVAEVEKLFPRGTVVIGEFAFDEFDTSSLDVATIFRCLPPKAIERQNSGRKIKFYIFDVLAYHGLEVYELSRKERQTYLNELDQKVAFSDYIQVIPWIAAENSLPLLEDTLAHGGEGMILMNLSEKYYPGSRRGAVAFKIKKEMGEMTLPVVGFVEPKKDYEGNDPDNWLYKIDDNPVTTAYYHGWKQGVVVNYKGREVKVTSGISNADAEWLASEDAAKLLEEGQLYAEISAMEEVKGANETSASLRHPVILRLRTDV